MTLFKASLNINIINYEKTKDPIQRKVEQALQNLDNIEGLNYVLNSLNPKNR